MLSKNEPAICFLKNADYHCITRCLYNFSIFRLVACTGKFDIKFIDSRAACSWLTLESGGKPCKRYKIYLRHCAISWTYFLYLKLQFIIWYRRWVDRCRQINYLMKIWRKIIIKKEQGNLANLLSVILWRG